MLFLFDEGWLVKNLTKHLPDDLVRIAVWTPVIGFTFPVFFLRSSMSNLFLLIVSRSLFPNRPTVDAIEPSNWYRLSRNHKDNISSTCISWCKFTNTSSPLKFKRETLENICNQKYVASTEIWTDSFMKTRHQSCLNEMFSARRIRQKCINFVSCYLWERMSEKPISSLPRFNTDAYFKYSRIISADVCVLR
jgi:hypothetical protein